VDFSVMLIDGALYKSGKSVIRKKGAVYIPSDAAVEILKAFYPDFILTRKENYLIWEHKATLEKPAEKKTEKVETGKAARDKITFIVIDAGHGGKDPGAVSRGKVSFREKNITLKIVKYVEAALKKRLKGIAIRLTRPDDRFVELSRRTEIANRLLKKHENGLFISIHVNASLSKKSSGFETYYLSQNPTNDEARTTAALENNVVVLEDKTADGSYGDIDYIEALMMTTQIQKESSMLADSLQHGLKKVLTSFKSNGVKKADFFVLRGVLMPAALVETGYLTNAKDAANLSSDAHQIKIGEGIAEGIEIFLKKYNNILSK